MDCPSCSSNNTHECSSTTGLGYQKYRCRDCHRQYNERTGTPFNFIEYPNEVVMLAVFYYYRFKVSLDDVVELMQMRGFKISHQTVHNWVQVFGVELGLKLRKKRYKQGGDKWHVDATYLRVEGRWCYLYRAIDKEGNLVDVYLSDVRDQSAAESFFEQAAKTSGIYPFQITTDKEAALYPAIENTFGDYTEHRDSKFKNNKLEQDHRGVKSRTKTMKGFKNIFTAVVFCTAYEEIRQFFRMQDNTRSERRDLFASRIQEFVNIAVA